MLTVYTNRRLQYTLNTFFSTLGVPYELKLDENLITPKIIFYNEPLTKEEIKSFNFEKIRQNLTLTDEEHLSKDKHGRPIFRKKCEKPTFDITLKQFKEFLIKKADSLNLPILFKCNWPMNKPFALCLTHDIDHVNPSFKAYIAGIKNFIMEKKLVSAIKWMILLLTKKNPWDVKNILELEEELGVKSTFFFLISKNHPKDTISPIPKIEKAIKLVVEKGWDVQLHGSYLSFNDLKLLIQEKELLEKIKSSPVEGIRQHYLRLNPENTFKYQQEAGFKFDSTLGFYDQIGFRACISFPFHPFDRQLSCQMELIEIPLAIMDSTLIGYLKISPEDAWDKIKENIDFIYEVSSLYTILWHNTYFDDTLKNWKLLYKKILKYSIEKNAFIGSSYEIFKWWINREKTTLSLNQFSSKEMIWSVKGFKDFCVKIFIPKDWKIITPSVSKINDSEVIIPIINNQEIIISRN